jgi:hypothetical protein
MISALLVTDLSQGAPGIKDLLRRMFMWKVCPKWWLIAFSPLLKGGGIVFLLNRVASSQIGMAELGAVNYLRPLGLSALLLWILTFGFGEETGCRGDRSFLKSCYYGGYPRPAGCDDR